MSGRVMLKIAVAAVVVLAIGYPIRQELRARSAIEHNLINSLDANDAAALRLWQGTAESFVAMLHDRCMRQHGGDVAACVRYSE
jgi:hypothetical protein